MATPKKTNPKKAGRKKTTIKQKMEKIRVSFDMVYELAATGITDAQLAKIFGVSEATITRWKSDSPEFLSVLKKGKEFADSLVEMSLYRRALGFNVDTEEIKVVSQGQGAGSEIERVDTVTYYPPDPTSAIFWLKNRRPDVWRDKVSLDIEVFNSFKAQVLEALRVLPQEHRDAFITALQETNGDRRAQIGPGS